MTGADAIPEPSPPAMSPEQHAALVAALAENYTFRWFARSLLSWLGGLLLTALALLAAVMAPLLAVWLLPNPSAWLLLAVVACCGCACNRT